MILKNSLKGEEPAEESKIIINQRDYPILLKDADKIRQYALEEFILPARKREGGILNFCAKDIHNGLNFKKSNYPNIIQAIEGKKFLEMARIKIIQKIAPETVTSGQSSTVCWKIRLEGEKKNEPKRDF